jgi:predicted flavoprotein YhiN
VLARGGTPTLTLDLRPDLSTEELAARLGGGRAKDSLSNRLRKAGGLPPVAVALLREVTANGLPTGTDDLARLVKSVAIPISGVSGLERAISSAGGIALDEIDGQFMLKKRPGTFVAGEMLDWDAPTGGYLLQAVFSTGKAAGEGAAAFLSDQLR